MAALTTSRSTIDKESPKLLDSIPVKASTKVFVGSIAAVDASGWGVPAADTAGLSVLGRCDGAVGAGLNGLDADNTAGANGAITMYVRRGIFKFANGTSGEALTIADVGKTCYVVDDQTVGKVGGTNKIAAGVVAGIEDGVGSVWVSMGGGRPTQDLLTDSSGGTPGTTIAAIGGTYNQAEVRNAVATLAAQINKIKADIAAILR